LPSVSAFLPSVFFPCPYPSGLCLPRFISFFCVPIPPTNGRLHENGSGCIREQVWLSESH
jgi:hypothetical protein